jgi:hypothetical protein
MQELSPVDLHRIRECSIQQILARFAEGFVHDRRTE